MSFAVAIRFATMLEALHVRFESFGGDWVLIAIKLVVVQGSLMWGLLKHGKKHLSSCRFNVSMLVDQLASRNKWFT